MKWRNSKERELLSVGGTRETTLPRKDNPNPDLSDAAGQTGSSTAGGGPTPRFDIANCGRRYAVRTPSTPSEVHQLNDGSGGGGGGGGSGSRRVDRPPSGEPEVDDVAINNSTSGSRQTGLFLVRP